MKKVMIAVEENFDTEEVASQLQKKGMNIESTKVVSGIIIGTTEDVDSLRIDGVFSVEEVRPTNIVK